MHPTPSSSRRVQPPCRGVRVNAFRASTPSMYDPRSRGISRLRVLGLGLPGLPKASPEREVSKDSYLRLGTVAKEEFPTFSPFRPPLSFSDTLKQAWPKPWVCDRHSGIDPGYCQRAFVNYNLRKTWALPMAPCWELRAISHALS